jgi:hypothetical protein
MAIFLGPGVERLRAVGFAYCSSPGGCGNPTVSKYACILLNCIGVGGFNPRALDIVHANRE